MAVREVRVGPSGVELAQEDLASLVLVLLADRLGHPGEACQRKQKYEIYL